MTVREIQGHLRELYGIEVSPDLISVVTDAVLANPGEPVVDRAEEIMRFRAGTGH
jgi:transposase-like protein